MRCLLRLFLGQNQYFLDQPSDVALLAVRPALASEAEHAGGDGRGSLTGFHDPLERQLLLRGLGVAHPEFRGVDDRGEDVVEFVGDARSQFADTAQPLGLEKLLTEAIRLTRRSQHLFAGHGMTPPLRPRGEENLPAGRGIDRTNESSSSEPHNPTRKTDQVPGSTFQIKESHHDYRQVGEWNAMTDAALLCLRLRPSHVEPCRVHLQDGGRHFQQSVRPPK